LSFSIDRIAKACHDVNQAYCLAIGDPVSLPYHLLSQEEKDSVKKGVQALIDNQFLSAQGLHEAWMADKKKDGWKLGPVKDSVRKTHPCMIDYYFLPQSQKVKDHLFSAVVKAMR
jgi:hypothetical protein